MTHSTVEFLTNLPKEIGSYIEIAALDNELRRKVEARGFFIETGTLQTYVMRRDFPDGYLKTA
jgi:hypothetical protein